MSETKEKKMSYAADGQLEPKFVEQVSENFLPDVMGYRVLVTEWSDGKYSLNIYKLLSLNDADVIQYDEVEYESVPDEDAIRLIIEETLEERADRGSDIQ
jgi:hypothetical protein